MVDVSDRLYPHSRVCVGVLEGAEMKDSEYFLLLGCIALAPQLSKFWAWISWFIYMSAAMLFVYLERT